MPKKGSPNIIYLSDILPFHWSQSYGRPQFDKTLFAPHIYVNNTLYEKGMGVHANSSISYKLLPCKEFKAVIGLDNRMDREDPNSYSAVRFSVYVDEKLSFQSNILYRYSKPQEISIPLTGAKELRLEVEAEGKGPDGNLEWGDEADWADARILL